MKRGIALVGVLVLMLAAAGVSHAGAISTLDDLFNGGSIIAGDKLFDNWSLGFYDTSDGRTLDATNITVAGLNDGGLNPGPGLNFRVSNGELDVTGDGIYAYIDLRFSFRVSVLDPTLKITDSSLRIMEAMLTTIGDNGMWITETTGTSLGTPDDLESMHVEVSYLDPSFGGPGLITNMNDSAVFAPQSEIWVTKNILVWASDISEDASLKGFDQRFSQSPVGVPEPGMLALLALGGIALLRFKRG